MLRANNQQPQGSDQPTSHVNDSAGNAQPVFLGSYSVQGLLGEGAIGRVYLATHTKLKRKIALKVLPPFSGQDVARIARFTRDMEIVGRIDHPNIVRATDAGEDQGMQYVAMEFVDGLDVKRVAEKRNVDQAAACEIIRQAAAGLQSIGDYGLVHRDIKPSNLMITQTGVVKILDLGTASLRSDEEAGPLTAEDGVLRTLDYIAPEQFMDNGRVDIRADIYSLGCTLYRLLSGHAPFEGPNYETNAAKVIGHLENDPRPISDLVEIPPELISVVQRMMEKDPDKRFQTPAEVVAAMCTWADGQRLPQLISRESTSAATATAQRYRTSIPCKANKSATATLVDSRRFPTWTRVAAGLLLTVATCVGGYILSNRAPDATPIPTEQLEVIGLESSTDAASNSQTKTALVPANDTTQAEAEAEAKAGIEAEITSEPPPVVPEGTVADTTPVLETQSEPPSATVSEIVDHLDKAVDAVDAIEPVEPESPSDTTSEGSIQLEPITNPTTDGEIYQNAGIYTQQGRLLLARASYLQLLNNGTQFIDVHKSFQDLLIQQEGVTRAREIYMSNLNRDNVTLTTELALVLLQKHDVKLRGLVSLVQRYPNFAPAVYELADSMSEFSQGSQTNAAKAQEIALLQSVKQLHSRGELLPHYLNQTEAAKIIETVEQRLAAIAATEETDNAKRNLAAVKFTWASFENGHNHRILSFTTLAPYSSVISQVAYGLNTNKPDKTFQLPKVESAAKDDLSIRVDDTVKYVVVRLTFTDGTKSQLVRIDRD